MTMPKMYIGEDQKKESKPMPLLKITRRMGVLAVNEQGKYLAGITNGRGHLLNAKGALETWGYDTSWAEWDGEGRFVRLKEGE